MTTTLSPELNKIYCNIVIETLHRFKQRLAENTPGYTYVLDGINDFPVAEEREDDIYNPIYKDEDINRSRYRRSADLILDYLRNLGIEFEIDIKIYSPCFFNISNYFFII